MQSRFFAWLIAAMILIMPLAAASSPSHTASPSSPSSHSSHSSHKKPPKPTPSPIPSPTPTGTPGPIPSGTLAVIQDMLHNEAIYGKNPCNGHLWINWIVANGTVTGNYNGTGTPDSNPCTRHDPATELRFVRNLLVYEHDTGDMTYAKQVAYYEPMVLANYANVDPRGWVYDDLMDSYKASGNVAFLNEAVNMANTYLKSGLNTTRIDWQIEEASVLVQEGKRSGNTVMLNTGLADLKATTSSIDTTYHLVFISGLAKSSQNGDIANAYARAGDTTDATLIQLGMQVMWDTTYGGYDEGAVLGTTGLTIQQKKTGGRMANMDELFHLLNEPTQQATITNVLLKDVYLPSLHGVLYEQHRDWSKYTINGTSETWVTSEAMGIMLEALMPI